MATVRYASRDVMAALLCAASRLYAQGRAILWSRRRIAAVAALCIGLQAGAALAADPIELNRLAARCAVCHSATAQATSPLLEGQPEAYFIAQMRAFRERRRTNPPMVAFANELNEQDVSALASYYAAREPAPVDPLAGPAQIEAGRSKATALRCAQCHGAALQGSSSGVARLAGQKTRYTAWALQMMRSGTRTHGSARDPLLSDLSNDDIEELAAWFASMSPR
jgi:cytochrome c553